MNLLARIRPVLGYRTLPTTTLLILIYVFAFSAIFVTDKLPAVPRPGDERLKGGLDSALARRDLEHITAQPHPYNSHANDVVRAYILDRLQGIAEGRKHVQIDDDLQSNASWAPSTNAAYFEGTNLLVKIDGTDYEASAVLFSAHYDSVSTARGATDDGMGVTTLLQLVAYFAKNQAKRTAIFNINNGEEDGLHGAHVFMQHPWSKLADTFLNLEGAAEGGRPIVFRSTSLKPIRAFFGPSRVPHPHANVIASDAFSRGFIRSGTDFSVYAGIDRREVDPKSIMEGLDLAFYKGRSRYHTKWDGVPYTEGGERSLWAMIEVAKGLGIGLLDAKTARNGVDLGNGKTKGVYFDLFKSALIAFPLSTLLTFNVVALTVGPIVLGLLWLIGAVLHRKETLPPPPPQRNAPAVPQANQRPASSTRLLPRTFGSSEETSGPHTPRSRLSKLSVRKLLPKIWKHASFWVSLVLTGVLQAALVWGYTTLNPFTIYSRPYWVLLSFFSLAYLSVVLPLKLAFPSSRIKHSTLVREQEKTTILLHFHFLTWILLLLATFVVAKASVAGVYVISIWYVGVWGASVVGAVQSIISQPGSDKGKQRVHFDEDTDSSDREVDDRPATEHTPLLSGNSSASPSASGATTAVHRGARGTENEGGAIGWWIIQVMFTVPLVLTVVGQIGTLLLDSMSQTLSDGSSATVVYAATSLTATFLVLPLAPFSPKLHRSITFIALITFVLSTAYLWLIFPFSSADPLKVFFQQKIELDKDSVFVNAHGEFGYDASTLNETANALGHQLHRGKVTTYLTGTPYFLRQRVLPNLPSARDSDVKCDDEKARLGLITCEWESGDGYAPHPGGKDPWSWWPDGSTGNAGDALSDLTWFKADITRTSRTSARISVQGRNTKTCRLYLDSGVKVIKYTVEGGSEGMQDGYPVNEELGVKEIRLWSRTWDKVWVVDLTWKSSAEEGQDGDTLGGRIACEWAEYESGMVDNGSFKGGTRPKIPAFEETLAFLPEWAVVSKTADGLVEAWVPFSI